MFNLFGGGCNNNCDNDCNSGFGGCSWIIILLLIFCFCGGGNSCRSDKRC